MTPSAACVTGGNGHYAETTRYGLNYYLHQKLRVTNIYPPSVELLRHQSDQISYKTAEKSGQVVVSCLHSHQGTKPQSYTKICPP